MNEKKLFKRLLIFAVATFMLLSVANTVSAAYVQVGTGTYTNVYVPCYGYYDYSITSVIYLQSDIGGSLDINAISYDVSSCSGAPFLMYDQIVYMGHTTDSIWPSSGYAHPDPGTLTKVYEGDVTWNVGWNQITLDTTFNYNGVDNLIVYWENHDGDYMSGYPYFRYTSRTGSCLRSYGDGTFPPSNLYRSSYQSNIRLHFPTNNDVAVTDIVTPLPVEGAPIPNPIPVRVEVKNAGLLDQSSFPVNVKINSPPVTIFTEGFEDTYGIRPNPPPGWLVRDENLDGYFSGVYAYNMWGSYYSSTYAHTGTMSMRYEYNYAMGGDDWLFTPGYVLNAGQSYTLEWWSRVSSSSYDEAMEVFIGTAQNPIAMTTSIWNDAAMSHTTHRLDSATFTVPVTGTYYIGFYEYSPSGYYNVYIDDVMLYIPGAAVYDQTVTMYDLSAGSTSEANLPDWNPSGPGTYEVVATTLLGGDEDPSNDVMTSFSTVEWFDAMTVSIDNPQALMGPVPFNPMATVMNVGAIDFNLVNGQLPVRATVLDPSGGTGTVFEEDFESPAGFNLYEGETIVEVNIEDVTDKHGEFQRIDGTIKWLDEETPLGDYNGWTILNPDNNGALWHQTDYKSSPSSPTHSMYVGDENTKQYLPYSYDIMISPKIHVGTTGGSFDFDIINDVEGAPYDYVVFGASPDGYTWGWWFGSNWWTTWMSVSGIPIAPSDVDANGDCYVAFAFFSDDLFEYEGVYIDNVKVDGSPYLYDETVFIDLPAIASAQVTFPTFTPLAGYDSYTINVCCEHPEDNDASNDCMSQAFITNAPVYNTRTGWGYASIQAAINAALPGDGIVASCGDFYEDIIIDRALTVSGTECCTYLYGTVDIVADGVTFENFYVEPLTLFTADQAAIAIYANDTIVRHNVVSIQGQASSTIKGIHVYAVPSDHKEDIEISNNTVLNVKNAPSSGVVTHYSSDFEADNGGWVPTATWDPVGDWEWSNTYNVGCYVGGEQPPPAAHGGTGLWGTVLCDDYTNSGGETLLSQTFDFTGLSDATLTFWQWSDLFGSWDYGEVFVNGAQVYYVDDYPGTAWEEVIIPLSSYDGMSSVEIVFSMHASTVVEYAGWYIDDLMITGTGSAGIGGATGIMIQGAAWDVDVLDNEVVDVHSGGWSYGIEVTPTALDPVDIHFQANFLFEEDFTGVGTGALPTGWTKTPSTTNWGAYNSANSGGIAPEMRFYYSPSSTDDFYVITPQMDTSDFDSLDFEFKHNINHYTTPYELKVVSIAGGTEYLIDSWTPSASQGATTETYTLTDTSHGVGAADFQIAWVFSGYSWNINYWYFDDVVLSGSYDYVETVYPWPLDVFVEGNYLARISNGPGYPWPDPPIYDGVQFSLDGATLPTGGWTPADASEVILLHNYFDPECYYPTYAILNQDPMNVLVAHNNFFGAPNGPGSFDPINDPELLVVDPYTGEDADGYGSQIIRLGEVNFDPWIGVQAIATITGSFEVGKPLVFDGSDSWGKDLDGLYDPQILWRFDDGAYSQDALTTHVYTSPGTYSGYLRVMGGNLPKYWVPECDLFMVPGWSNMMFDWYYFTIDITSPGAPLDANAGGGSLKTYETINGEEITLTGSASGGTAPYNYVWDLGDGRTIENQNPTVTYWLDEENPVTTTYTATLTVTDDNYDISTDTVSVIVLGTEELLLSINAPSQSAPGLTVAFTSNVLGGKAPYTYSWNFGDGTTSIEANPHHIYENTGVYSVQATVTDGTGAVKSTTHTITVETSESSEAQIKSVKGGLLVSATISAGENPVDWSISVEGRTFMGGSTQGTILANAQQTVRLPFTFGIGQAEITITADDITQRYTAFMLGPFFLNLQSA